VWPGLGREPSADALEVRIDGFRDRAIVKRVAAALGNHAVGARQIEIAADVILVRRNTAGHIRVQSVVNLFDLCPETNERHHVALDVVADDLRRGVAIFAGVDGRLEQLGPFEFAVTLVQGPPSIQATGRGDADRAQGGNRAILRPGTHCFQSESFRRAAGAGHAGELAHLGIPYESEAVAAEAGADRLYKTEHRVGGDSSIDRGATALQHCNGGLRGQRMSCAGRAIQAECWRARGETRARGTIAGVHISANEFFLARRLKRSEGLFGYAARGGGAAGLGRRF
jgi:hypothetical protein